LELLCPSGEWWKLFDEIPDRGLKLGRSEMAEANPALVGMAEKHARFGLRGRDLVVEDLGSLNGVYLKLTRPWRLLEGDRFRIGRQVIEFRHAGPTATAESLRAEDGETFLSECPTVQAFLDLIGPDGKPGIRFPVLDPEGITIGRLSDQSDLMLAGNYLASRQHARVRRVGDEFFLEDLDSTNGTFVRVRGTATLAPGDHILLGEILLRVSESGASTELPDRKTRDPVECTVFAPPAVAPGSPMLVQVFAHLPDQGEAAQALARDFDAAAIRRGFKTLEVEVERGATLNFHLEMPGLVVRDPVQSLTWRGRPEAVQFGVEVPADRQPGTVVGSVSVSLDGVPVGHIKFKLDVTRGCDPVEAKPTGDVAHRYSAAFISYAAPDRAEVLKRVQILASVGIRYFQDVLDLDPGSRWEETIYRRIDESDLFLLFWSSHAKRSEWVLKEVRYALQLKGGCDERPPEIRPVILEGPPVPEPPEELSNLHFNDYILYLLR
jgi:pSer/pThr/pTyr-binding forkhead associated (FHA) protein